MIDDKAIEQAHFGQLDKRQIISLGALKGKTIHPIADSVFDSFSGYMIWHFNDNKFAIFESVSDYGIELVRERPSPWDLYGLRLVAKEDYETYQRDLKSQHEKAEKEFRRRQYEKLRAEFERD